MALCVKTVGYVAVTNAEKTNLSKNYFNHFSLSHLVKYHVPNTAQKSEKENTNSKTILKQQ